MPEVGIFGLVAGVDLAEDFIVGREKYALLGQFIDACGMQV